MQNLTILTVLLVFTAPIHACDLPFGSDAATIAAAT
jgi:hypothetical protein